MKTFAVHITEDGKLQPWDTDRALAEETDGSGPFWIRVNDYKTAELHAWLNQISLSPFARNRLLNQGEMTKVIPLTQGIMMDLRVLPAAENVGLKQIAVLCLENLVICLDPGATHESTVADSPVHEFELMDPSVTGILLSVLLQEAKRVGRESCEIRSTVLRLDERMDREPGGVSLEEILDAKGRLQRLFSVAEEQSECFKELTALENTSLDFSRLQGSVHLLLSAAGFSERVAERLEKWIADLRQRYDAHQQEKLNHRLSMLTVVSSIFLPLTLIAGIWGMNFKWMPELAHPLGYPMALSVMTGVVGGMLWFFRRKGWFE